MKDFANEFIKPNLSRFADVSCSAATKVAVGLQELPVEWSNASRQPPLRDCVLQVLAVLAFLCSGCASSNAPAHPPDLPLVYHNARYGLTLFLPTTWAGYSVMIEKWEGLKHVSGKNGPKVVARGPIIVLRHPQWKAAAPCQDIPIRVFTRVQWETYHQDGGFFLDAGGIDQEISHNYKYVFSVHSRFNWCEAAGWEEAGQIVQRNSDLNAPHLNPM